MEEVTEKAVGYMNVSTFETQVQQLITLFNVGVQKIEAKQKSGPKFAVEPFLYEDELDACCVPEHGRTSQDVIGALSAIVEGSLRPQSANGVYNMVPQPLPETVVASALMQLYNLNAIMDSYGGKSLLYEQQVSRSVGKLVGWQSASGLSCSGGKQTLFYAVKSAIDRISPEAKTQGVPNDLVILTAVGAHYSIEHVCELAGIGREACIRIPVSSSNGVDSSALESVFVEQINRGKRVAAIIGCGGTTLDFLCDNTATLYDTAHRVYESQALGYFPYLHLDSVIGWLWFCFLTASDDDFLDLDFPQSVVHQIKSVTGRFSAIDKFDSLGVDFHKNALCPYSSSFFIRRNGLCRGNDRQPKLGYGDLCAFTQTVENSRSASGIASAWVALQFLGMDGLRRYLGGLLCAGDRLKTVFNQEPRFRVLNGSSCGWELIFNVAPSDELSCLYSVNLLHEGFYYYMQKRVESGQDVPNISIIKSFAQDQQGNSGHGLIIYNMTPNLTDDGCDRMKAAILSCWDVFEKRVMHGVIDLGKLRVNEPIR